MSISGWSGASSPPGFGAASCPELTRHVENGSAPRAGGLDRAGAVVVGHQELPGGGVPLEKVTSLILEWFDGRTQALRSVAGGRGKNGERIVDS